MQLDEWQQALHRLYQGDVEYPTNTDDEWTHRTGLLLAAINAWNTEKGILWNELFVQLSDAADGDKTISASDLTYDAPTDFEFLATYARVTNSAGNHAFYSVVKPQKSELFKNEGRQAVFVTGNKKTGRVINFMKQPTAGETINYGYYKTPFEPSSDSHVIEMADPYFAVYFALAHLHKDDGDGDEANLAFSMAEAKLKAMRVRNEMPPWLQENYIPDAMTETGTPGFGV